MVEIKYAYLSQDAHEYLLKEYLPKFSMKFQERIRRYRRWQDAQLSLLGRILLSDAMEQMGEGSYWEKEMQFTQYDKPYFDKSTIQFNISHSGEMVVCAIGKDSAIGIDIERLAKIKVEDFASQMTANEWSRVNGAGNKLNAFYDYWTQKEAVIKTHGKGLSLPLKSFEITDNIARVEGEVFYLNEIQLDDKYKCYLGLKYEKCEIEVKEILVKDLVRGIA